MVLKDCMGLIEAVDYAVIQTYKKDLGAEFTICSLYNDCSKEFNFNKRQLAIVPQVLQKTGLVVKTGEYARTYSEGRVAGMAAVYMRVGK